MASILLKFDRKNDAAGKCVAEKTTKGGKIPNENEHETMNTKCLGLKIG